MKKFITLSFLVCWWFFLSLISVAQGPADCLEKANQIILPGKSIIIVQNEGLRISGRLKTIDLGQSTLTMSITEATQESKEEIYNIINIDKIGYRAPGKLKPAVMLLGFLGGAVIGGLIGGLAEPDELLGRGINIAIGVGIGGGGGLLLGTVGSLGMNSTHYIKCK